MKKYTMHKRHLSGITLVSLLIVLALLTIVMLSITRAMMHLARSQKSTELSVDFSNLYNSVMNVLSSSNSCTTALSTTYLNPTNGAPLAQLALGSTIIAKVGQPPLGLSVTDLSIVSPTQVGTRTSSAGVTQKQFSAVFRIQARKVVPGGKLLPGANEFVKSIGISVFTDPAQTNGAGDEKIVECYGQSSDATACEELGGSDSAYSTAQTPRCVLGRLALAQTHVDQRAALDGAFGNTFVVVRSQAAPKSGVAYFADNGKSGGDPNTYLFLRNLTAETPTWGLSAAASGAFGIHQAGVGDRLYVGSDGRVGVGVTNPGLFDSSAEFQVRSLDGGNTDVSLTALGANASTWGLSSVSSDGRLEIHGRSGAYDAVPMRIYKAPEDSLVIEGNGTIRGAFGTYHAPSDSRLKTAIRPITDALKKILSLRGVSFRWKEDDGKTHLGLIAQEVEKVVPEAVHTRGDAVGTKAVHYESLVPVLINAIQEQQKRID